MSSEKSEVESLPLLPHAHALKSQADLSSQRGIRRLAEDVFDTYKYFGL